MQIYRAAGDRHGESETLAYLSLLQHHLGNQEAALESSQQALAIALDVGLRAVQANALTFFGHAALALLRLDEAEEAYRHALDIRRDLDQANLAIEPSAGLARVALARDDLALAAAHVERIVGYLETNALDGIEEPFWVYLTCYHVMKASRDPRAARVLGAAQALLDERASKISDPETRRSFLENVATCYDSDRIGESP